MPSILKVRIISAKNLPVMDRATELTDAFVEIHFADYDVLRTQIKRRTLNPVWNEDFRLEISDDADLQNEPLELKVLDWDQITYNDAIGSIFIDLNPLLTWDSAAQISGWLPIFDTLHGVRGYLNVQVKIQFFGDMNPFKDSSAGVQFYTMKSLNTKYPVTNVLGLVTALDTEDDPEYHWSDNFRTPRTSNEARTRLLFRLCGKLRRILGRKVLEMGGNAVVGYKQYFDFEQEKRTVTVRAIGSAVLMNISTVSNPGMAISSITASPSVTQLQQPRLEIDSIKEMELDEALEPQTPVVPFNKQSDVSILTLNSFPPNSMKGIGGFVCSTSVKIIDSDESEIHEQWWSELRDEIKIHAKTLNCTHIIAYAENTTVYEDLIILHCHGTAVNLKFDPFDDIEKQKNCQQCHITYSRHSSPFPMSIYRCFECKKRHVPEMLLASCDPPQEMAVIGKPVLLEAHVCRPKKSKPGESNATSVSEALPFAQYDLHRQIMYKLRLYGLNAVFGLKIQFSAGDNMLIAVATGTAMYVRALPPLPVLKVMRNLEVLDEEDEQLLDIQRRIVYTSEQNRIKLEAELKSTEIVSKASSITESQGPLVESSCSESSDESDNEIARNSVVTQTPGAQKNVVIQIDDEQDEDLVLLTDSHQDMRIINTESIENCPFPLENCHSLTVVKQGAINSSHHPNRQLSNIFNEMYQEIATQLSYFEDCIVAGTNYSIQMVEEDEFTIQMTASAIGKSRAFSEFPDTFTSAIPEWSLFGEIESKILQVEQSNEFILGESLIFDSPLQLSSPFASLIPKAKQLFKDRSLISEPMSGTMSSTVSSASSESQTSYFEDDEDSFKRSAQITKEPTLSSHVEISLSRSGTRQHLSSQHIEISNLGFIPNTRIEKFLGRFCLHFIKESALLNYENPSAQGAGSFNHCFLTEVYAISRSFAKTLGGNGLLSFSIEQSIFEQSIKNQGYALLTVSADVVLLRPIN